MQFQVPQFLDVEDKIIGPLTIKQFLYVAGGTGLGYLSYRAISVISGFIGGIVGLGFLALGIALAFYKFNNKPLIFLIESAFYYFMNTRLFVWKRVERERESKLNLNNFKPTTHSIESPMKTISSKLSDIAWSIDVRGKESSDDRKSSALGL